MSFKEAKIAEGFGRSNGALTAYRAGQERPQVVRPFGLEFKRFTAGRVPELEPGGVQCLPRSQPLEGLGLGPLDPGNPAAAAAAVDRIAYHGMAGVGQVHPDLVGAAGVEFQPEQVGLRRRAAPASPARAWRCV